jgi:hypothetical protein
MVCVINNTWVFFMYSSDETHARARPDDDDDDGD